MALRWVIHARRRETDRFFPTNRGDTVRSLVHDLRRGVREGDQTLIRQGRQDQRLDAFIRQPTALKGDKGGRLLPMTLYCRIELVVDKYATSADGALIRKNRQTVAAFVLSPRLESRKI